MGNLKDVLDVRS